MKKLNLLHVVLVLSLFCGSILVANAFEIVTKEVDYKVDGEKVTFKGFIAHPKDTKDQKGSAVIIVHEWWGHNDYVRNRAKMLAELGHTAFALDMYGNGKVATHPKDAGQFATEVMGNFSMAVKRFKKALEVLKSEPSVGKTNDKISGIGYCFGGSVLLSLARMGEANELSSIVSFHGGLKLPVKAKAQGYKGTVLVLTGAKDPFIPAADIQTFKTEMTEAKIAVTIVEYPNATHAFSNPEATLFGKKFNLPLAYDENADKESWTAMLKVL